MVLNYTQEAYGAQALVRHQKQMAVIGTLRAANTANSREVAETFIHQILKKCIEMPLRTSKKMMKQIRNQGKKNIQIGLVRLDKVRVLLDPYGQSTVQYGGNIH